MQLVVSGLMRSPGHLYLQQMIFTEKICQKHFVLNCIFFKIFILYIIKNCIFFLNIYIIYYKNLICHGFKYT